MTKKRSDNDVSMVGQGLLDIATELSTTELTAGKEFSVYVLLKNPYNSPISIRSVTVSVPSEIELPQWIAAEKQNSQIKQDVDDDNEKRREKIIETSAERKVKIIDLEKLLTETESKYATSKVVSEKTNIEQEIASLRLKIEKEKIISEHELGKLKRLGTVSVNLQEGAEITSVDVVSTDNIDLNLQANSKIADLRIGHSLQGVYREVDLLSSLPNDAPLQPGDTAVYTIILRTKSSILFKPSQYKLHFNVTYRVGFSSIRVNTISTTLNIRAAISSMMTGAMLGGFTGFVARQLQTFASLNDLMKSGASLPFALLVSVILSAVSVVFIARKSETQSFVSVEDFWGGVMIGFLVGYSGVTAFQSISGVQPQ